MTMARSRPDHNLCTAFRCSSHGLLGRTPAPDHDYGQITTCVVLLGVQVTEVRGRTRRPDDIMTMARSQPDRNVKLEVKCCQGVKRWVKSCGHGSRWGSNHMWTRESLGVSGDQSMWTRESLGVKSWSKHVDTGVAGVKSCCHGSGWGSAGVKSC